MHIAIITSNRFHDAAGYGDLTTYLQQYWPHKIIIILFKCVVYDNIISSVGEKIVTIFPTFIFIFVLKNKRV